MVGIGGGYRGGRLLELLPSSSTNWTEKPFMGILAFPCLVNANKCHFKMSKEDKANNDNVVVNHYLKCFKRTLHFREGVVARHHLFRGTLGGRRQTNWRLSYLIS